METRNLKFMQIVFLLGQEHLCQGFTNNGNCWIIIFFKIDSKAGPFLYNTIYNLLQQNYLPAYAYVLNISFKN